jgi:hypothetical protein
MPIMELLSALLFILLLTREILSYRERNAMLDRLMAKSLPEYKDNTKQEENKLEPVDDGTVSLEEAEEDLLNGGKEE